MASLATSLSWEGWRCGTRSKASAAPHRGQTLDPTRIYKPQAFWGKALSDRTFNTHTHTHAPGGSEWCNLRPHCSQVDPRWERQRHLPHQAHGSSPFRHQVREPLAVQTGPIPCPWAAPSPAPAARGPPSGIPLICTLIIPTRLPSTNGAVPELSHSIYGTSATENLCSKRNERAW